MQTERGPQSRPLSAICVHATFRTALRRAVHGKRRVAGFQHAWREDFNRFPAGDAGQAGPSQGPVIGDGSGTRSKRVMARISRTVATQKRVSATHARWRSNGAGKMNMYGAVSGGRCGARGQNRSDGTAGRNRMPVRRISWVGFRDRASRKETVAGKEAFWIAGRRRCTPGRAMCSQMDRRRCTMVEYRRSGISYVSSRRYHDYIGVYGKVGIKRVVRVDIQGPGGWCERIRLGHGVVPDHAVGIVDGDINVNRFSPGGPGHCSSETRRQQSDRRFRRDACRRDA
jgi:hypothetical protein